MELCESLLQRRRLDSTSRLSLRQIEEISEVARLLFVAYLSESGLARGPCHPPVEHPWSSITALPRRSTRRREMGHGLVNILSSLSSSSAWICSFLQAANEQPFRVGDEAGVVEAAAPAVME